MCDLEARKWLLWRGNREMHVAIFASVHSCELILRLIANWFLCVKIWFFFNLKATSSFSQIQEFVLLNSEAPNLETSIRCNGTPMKNSGKRLHSANQQFSVEDRLQTTFWPVVSSRTLGRISDIFLSMLAYFQIPRQTEPITSSINDEFNFHIGIPIKDQTIFSVEYSMSK